nr:hypothetical protein [Tanacetum cinerariifolium]
MDDTNISMEEYIRLEEEKAQRHGRTFNWQTTTFGKVKYYEDEDDCFTDFETKFLAIVFDNTLTSDTTPSCEPTKYCGGQDMAPLPPRDQRHLWLHYQVEGYTEEIVHDFEQRMETIFGRQVNRVHILDFEGLNLEMRQDFAVRLRMVYTRGDGQLVFAGHAWRRLFRIRAPLVHEFILEFLSTCQMSDIEMGLDKMAEAGFGAYWDGNDRVIPKNGDLRDYWTEISGQAPKKVTGVDLCYLSSIDRETANVPHLLAQYLFRHAKGRKSRARLLGGHFIGCLTAHFGLVSDEGLRGLQVVARELPLIDLHELKRLNIFLRFNDTRAWVALGPERKHTDTIGAHKGDKAGLAVDEGAQDIPAPIQASQPPPPAPQPWTITLLCSSGLPYQRRVRPRIGDASTSVAPHTDDNCNP